MFRHIFVPLARGGWLIVAAAVAIAIASWWLWTPLAAVTTVIALWCIYFFRDPPRLVPQQKGLVIAPADGRILPIETHVPPPELALDDTPRPRVSIFMDIFDVHVNRAPIDGEVVHMKYIAGRFFNASLDKASLHNERQALTIRMEDDCLIGMVMIAGLVARRIRCDIKTGKQVAAGNRVGLIRFGSRVDIYLPPDTSPLVIAGQRSIAGETVLADLTYAGPARVGRKV